MEMLLSNEVSRRDNGGYKGALRLRIPPALNGETKDESWTGSFEERGIDTVTRRRSSQRKSSRCGLTALPRVLPRQARRPIPRRWQWQRK